MDPNSTVGKPRFIDRVSVFGLEFAVAMITVIISLSVLSFAVFALCGYFANGSDGNNFEGGYFALWSAASTIVWVPVALIFYLRSRYYMAQHPEITSHPVQRTFVIIYQVFMILSVISFSVAAVYATLMSFVQVGDTLDILVRAALPSVVSALLFAGGLIAFFRQPVVRRRTFTIVFSVIALLIVVPTIIVSVTSLRASNQDTYKEADLYSIKAAVDAYDQDNGKLPSKMSDFTSLVDSDKTKSRLNEYTYRKVGSDRYQLCTNFASSNTSRVIATPLYEDSYQTYVTFGQHHAGSNCFKLRVSKPYYNSYDSAN